jgi:tetratricopeptide (TPR) repeat protein
LFPIYESLISVYDENDESLSIIVRDDLKFPYVEKMLNLLRPWSASINLNSSSLSDSLTGDQINRYLQICSTTEWKIALIYTQRNQFGLADSHCRRALSHARLYEGEEEGKTDLLCQALRVCGNLEAIQGNYIDAVAFAEEAYDCVAVVYNPVHPEVQKAASILIEYLSLNDDLYNAERFAQATLDSLKDPANKVDQQSADVADGYYNLATVIGNQEEDLVRAEMLARESLRIRTLIFHNDHPREGSSSSLLANILYSEGKMNDETKDLCERALAIETKNYGPDWINTAASIGNLGKFYCKLAGSLQTHETRKKHLHLSQSKYKESVRIFTKELGPDNPRTAQFSSNLSLVSSLLSKYE